jgi:hypothetical protein
MLQLDDQVDVRPLAHGGEAEEILNVDDADAAQLHVVAQRALAEADQLAVRVTLHRHPVVGHQAVAARDQVEGRLALPYPALADQQHAEAVDLQQNAVQAGRGDEMVLQEVADPLDDGRREGRRRQHRHLAPLALSEESGQRIEPLGDDEHRHRQAGDRLQPAVALLLVQGLQVLGLALADDLDTTRLDVGVVAREGEARLLHPWMGDLVVEVGLARDDFQVEIVELLAQELGHGNG